MAMEYVTMWLAIEKLHSIFNMYIIMLLILNHFF